MTRVLSEVMRDYLQDHTERRGPLEELRISVPRGDLPIQPSTSEWSVTPSPRTLVRAYEFDDHTRLADFVSEVLAHESETGHHARIECEHPKVTVSLRTHDLNDVTELDREHAAMCDKIYRDVLDYGYDDGDEGY